MTFVNNLHQGLVPGIQPLANNQLFCIAIGYSAGGFEAVKELLCSLPTTNNNFSIVLSQSLEDSQFHALACLLSANLLWDMHRPEEGEMVMPGLIYAAIPGEAILIAENSISMQPGKQAAEGFPADALFLSVAASASEKSIAVVLSGMGREGATGVKSIKAVGGMVLVQRPETSKYDGMPKATIATGCADAVLSPVEIGKMIECITKQQSLSLKDDAGQASTTMQPHAKLVVMNTPIVSIEHLVKERLYAGYEYTYIIIDGDCNILEVNGDATLYLDLKTGHIPCNLYDVLHQDLQMEVKSIIDDAVKKEILYRGALEIFELDNEIVFIRIMIQKAQNEKNGKEVFVLIFENLDPKGFTAKGINNGKLINGLRFQQFAKGILASAKATVEAVQISFQK